MTDTSIFTLQLFEREYDIVEFFLAIVLPFVAVLTVFVLLFFLQKNISAVLNLNEHQTRRLKRMYALASVLIVLIFSVILANQFVVTRRVLSFVRGVFFDPFYSSESTSVSLFTIFMVLMLVYISARISSRVRKASYDFIHKNSTVKRQKASAISRLLQYGFLVCFFVFGLPLIGIDLTSLSILFGVLGFGLGFGLQDITSNFFSGITIGFSQTVSEGDRIAINNIEGDIVKINFLNTEVRTVTNENLVVPNKMIVTEVMHNHTKNDPHVLINSSVEVAYDQDIELVETLLLQAGTANAYRIQTTSPVFRMAHFGESGIEVAVWIWIDDVRQKYAARSELNKEVWRQFVRHGIRIPFPQRDININNDDIRVLAQSFAVAMHGHTTDSSASYSEKSHSSAQLSVKQSSQAHQKNHKKDNSKD